MRTLTIAFLLYVLFGVGVFVGTVAGRRLTRTADEAETLTWAFFAAIFLGGAVYWPLMLCNARRAVQKSALPDAEEPPP